MLLLPRGFYASPREWEGCFARERGYMCPGVVTIARGDLLRCAFTYVKVIYQARDAVTRATACVC